jgi:hypothetical protein
MGHRRDLVAFSPFPPNSFKVGGPTFTRATPVVVTGDFRCVAAREKTGDLWTAIGCRLFNDNMHSLVILQGRRSS